MGAKVRHLLAAATGVLIASLSFKDAQQGRKNSVRGNTASLIWKRKR